MYFFFVVVIAPAALHTQWLYRCKIMEFLSKTSFQTQLAIEYESINTQSLLQQWDICRIGP